MHWHEWVVLIAGSTASALRAVALPNLHIVPEIGTMSFTPRVRRGPCSARLWPSWPMPRSGRDFSVWIGLVPKQHSSGGKEKLGSISKRGGRYVRGLFAMSTLVVIRKPRSMVSSTGPWLARLLARRPTKVAAVALANKIARIAMHKPKSSNRAF